MLYVCLIYIETIVSEAPTCYTYVLYGGALTTEWGTVCIDMTICIITMCDVLSLCVIRHKTSHMVIAMCIRQMTIDDDCG